MAHQLDLLDAIGLEPPVGGEPAEHAAWRETFLAEFDAFCAKIDAGKRVPGLDAYGAEDEREFFAVATESFFETGAVLQSHHPRVYQVLAGYYDQDPAAWVLPKSRRPVPGESGRQRRRRLRAEARRRRKSTADGS
jgi:Mlc titration factor MtfA (ptsG expression regulator)